jgi:hypothetical protein
VLVLALVDAERLADALVRAAVVDCTALDVLRTGAALVLLCTP